MNDKTQQPAKERTRHVTEMANKSRTHKIRKVSKRDQTPAVYIVTSGASLNEYTVLVNLDGTTGCNCKFATLGGTVEPWTRAVTCSHTIAVLERRAHQQHRLLRVTTDPNAYKKSRRIRQDGVTIATVVK